MDWVCNLCISKARHRPCRSNRTYCCRSTCSTRTWLRFHCQDSHHNLPRRTKGNSRYGIDLHRKGHLGNLQVHYFRVGKGMSFRIIETNSPAQCQWGIAQKVTGLRVWSDCRMNRELVPISNLHLHSDRWGFRRSRIARGVAVPIGCSTLQYVCKQWFHSIRKQINECIRVQNENTRT